MEVKTLTFEGDSPGTSYQLRVLEFHSQASSQQHRKIYLQGALHADELPGALVLHHLAAELRAAEADDRIAGSIVLVTLANPIGLAQRIFNRNEGRFSLSTAKNFNRDFPLLNPADGLVQEQAQALANDLLRPVIDRLKAALLAMALEADIVLDLHADSEAISYVYLPEMSWPAAEDLPACLGSDAVVLWDSPSDAAFEEAAVFPFLCAGAGKWPSFVSTIELRGVSDVSSKIAKNDANSLITFLCKQGFVGQRQGHLMTTSKAVLLAGKATPIGHVELIIAPEGGIVDYHASPGDPVSKGDNLVTLITRPGLSNGEIHLEAPQDGIVLSRYNDRYAQRGDTLLKVLGEEPSTFGGKGTLDN